MTCPFQIERTRMKPNDDYSNLSDDILLTVKYVACKLMSSADDDCIGEDQCPIMKN